MNKPSLKDYGDLLVHTGKFYALIEEAVSKALKKYPGVEAAEARLSILQTVVNAVAIQVVATMQSQAKPGEQEVDGDKVMESWFETMDQAFQIRGVKSLVSKLAHDFEKEGHTIQ